MSVREGTLPQEPKFPNDTIAQAKDVLRAAASDAADTLVEISRSGGKDDAVRRQAANDILAINGISPNKPKDDSSARIVGTAIVSALVGLARANGLRNVTPATFKKVLAETVPADDLPPELADQEALR